MGCVFHRIGNNLRPAPGTRILRAQEYANFLEAQNVLDCAQKQAQVIQEQAKEAYEARRKEGYDDGVMEGQMQQAEKMLETGMQAVEYLEGLERQIVEVVTTAVRKIIGELDREDLIVRVVRKALDQVRGRQRVVIRVSPEDEPKVREAFAAMLSHGSSSSGYELVADQRMKRGDCMLESEMGVVDASLEVQLKAIENALAARIGERTN